MLKTATAIIDALGGTTKTAEICGVSAAAVSQWRKNGIPHAQLRFLLLARPKKLRHLAEECRKLLPKSGR